jgi:hypothetical protein
MATELPPIFIHIGLPKAGSTWLQKSIFPNIEGIYYADPKQKANQPVENLIKAFINASGGMNIKGGLEVGGLDTNTLLNIKQELNTFRRTINTPLLISREGFTNPLYYSDLHGQKYGLSMLAEIVPNAKIMWLIRRQDTFVESLYRNWLQKGSSIEYKFFYNNITFGLDYLQIYQQLLDIFGVNNVFIQPVERIWKYPNFGSNFFADCFGLSPEAIPIFQNNTPSNVGSSRARIAIINCLPKVKRALNKLGINSFTKILDEQVKPSIKKVDMELVRYGLLKKIDFLSDYDKKLILNQFSENNLKLSSKSSIPLKEFGYFDKFSTR